jgi:hypothetical protein
MAFCRCAIEIRLCDGQRVGGLPAAEPAVIGARGDQDDDLVGTLHPQ